MFDGFPRWPIYLAVVVAVVIAAIYPRLGPAIGATSSADDVCDTVSKMSDADYPKGSGLIVTFDGVKSDCAATTVTLAFRVAANRDQMANVWNQADKTLRQQLCGEPVFGALIGRGWTVKAVYSLADQSAHIIRATSCPAGAA